MESEIGSFEKAIEARDLAEKEWIWAAAIAMREMTHYQRTAAVAIMKLKKNGVLKFLEYMEGG